MARQVRTEALVYVGLLCGVNVGGKNSMPMVELRGLFESLGFSDVRLTARPGSATSTAADTAAATAPGHQRSLSVRSEDMNGDWTVTPFILMTRREKRPVQLIFDTRLRDSCQCSMTRPVRCVTASGKRCH